MSRGGDERSILGGGGQNEWMRLREKEVIRGEEVMGVRDQSIKMIINLDLRIMIGLLLE